MEKGGIGRLEADRRIRSVTNFGIVLNIILSAVKAVVGMVTGSFALVADAVHSLSDMATDLVVLLGVHMSSKEPDEKHQYGHGRSETFATSVIGIILMAVGGLIIVRAATDMASNRHSGFTYLGLSAAALSIVVKEVLYRMTKKVAFETHSTAAYANAWHHRSDALSSVAVVAGFVALWFGYRHGDQMAAAAVGLMILLVAIHIVAECLNEFTETAVDSKTREHIRKIIDSNHSIRQWHKLRTRTVGREVFLDLHILVDPELSIAAAHDIAENLENSLHEEITRPVNIIVHVEPDIPELRRPEEALSK